MTYTQEQLELKKAEIKQALGLERLPVNLTPEQTSNVLDTSVNTLACWRSSGLYCLPFTKISRRVAYPLSGVAEFLLKRTVNHTGEYAK